VASLQDLGARLKGFDVELLAVDGHDLAAMEQVLARPATGRPRVILLRTIKGKGVSYMEGRLEWHYKSMDEAQYQRALAEVGA
jgi:transketolase